MGDPDAAQPALDFERNPALTSLFAGDEWLTRSVGRLAASTVQAIHPLLIAMRLSRPAR